MTATDPNTLESLNHLTYQEYRQYPAVSQSDLKACWENPVLYRRQHVEKDLPRSKPTEAQTFGTRCEAFIKNRGPEGADGIVIIPEGVLTANGHRRGEKWKAFEKAHEGKILMKESEYEEEFGALSMALENVLQHPYANGLIYDPLNQWHTKWTWQEPQFDLPMKCELDIINVPKKIVVDVKTAIDPTPRAFINAVGEFGYDMQGAHYLNAVDQLETANPNDFRYYWVVIRNKAPYDVEVYAFNGELYAFGFERLYWRKVFFRQCRDEDNWSLVGSDSVRDGLEIPPWWRMKHDREAAERIDPSARR